MKLNLTTGEFGRAVTFLFQPDFSKLATSGVLVAISWIGMLGGKMEKELALSKPVFRLWYITVRCITPVAVGAVFIYNLFGSRAALGKWPVCNGSCSCHIYATAH
ncbi:MAG: hypothetical protein V7760_05005 [Marinobacter sp.]